MNVLIVGAGAIGALYGMMLQRAGAEIFVLCRRGCQEIAERGIRVDSIWGNGTLTVNQAFPLDSIPETSFDLILVATKVLSEDRLSESLTPLIDKNTTILLMQNGLHIEKPFIERYPKNEILSALAFVCSNRLDLCHVEHLDYGRLVVGRAQEGDAHRLDNVIEMFTQSGVPIEKSSNIEKDRWIKLVWNVPFNPLSVLGGFASTTEILANPESRGVAHALMLEIIETARASGYYLERSLAEEMMVRTENMKPYRTSMLLDYEAGRPMEIEAIVGEPLRVARKLGQSVPHLETIYAILLLIDRLHS